MRPESDLETWCVWQNRWERSVNRSGLVAMALITMMATPAKARRVDWTHCYSTDDTHAKLIHVRFLHTQWGDFHYQYSILSEHENGQCKPGMAELKPLAALFDKQPSWFWG